MASALLEVTDLTKRYGERTAVRGVSFAVAEKEIFGLLGPNGAGKTTTLSVLATLLPPDGGKVLVCGHDVVREGARVKRLIGLVPQDLALYPTLSARDNLAFFGRIYGLSGRPLRERIDQVLDLVGLRERADDAIRTFSGGMKRRINIAAGLMHQPRVLFLDEPTVGVDPQSRNFIFEHVKSLRARGMSIIYTTHYMEEAERLCDRVAIMDEGCILALDTPRGLVALLGGGVILLGVPPQHLDAFQSAILALTGVHTVTVEDGRLKIMARDARQALLELIHLCNSRDVPMLSLEVLEPNLESVFLHLTGKRLRE